MWEDIAMDFVCGLPKLEGKSIIYVVVDIAHFIPLSHPCSAAQVAKVYFD